MDFQKWSYQNKEVLQNFEKKFWKFSSVVRIMYSETAEDVASSDSGLEESDKNLPHLFFNQKSLNFNSETEFLNSKFKTIGDNLRMFREKSFKLSKNLVENGTHKFSIDNILGQLKNGESETENEIVDKDENKEYELYDSPVKSPDNRESGKFFGLCLWCES